jgi:hypothetical protein
MLKKEHFNLYYIFKEDKENHPVPNAVITFIQNVLKLNNK